MIAFTQEADFHRATVSGGGKATIEQVMSEVLGAPTRLIIDQSAAKTAPTSIAEEEASARAAHERTVEYRVRHHPSLMSALRVLGGEIEHVQIFERERAAPAAAPVPDTPDETA